MWTYNYNYNNELYHYGVLGMKWGIRRARINASKAQKYKKRGNSAKAAKYDAKSKSIISKHKNRAGKKAFDRIDAQSTGRLVAKSLLMGTYGTLKYEQARARGVAKGEAILTGVLYRAGDTLTYGLLGSVEPRVSAKQKS